MGLKEATIYLDNDQKIYYAGQTVNGRIEYYFDSPKKVRGILVKFKGEAHTEWSETKESVATTERQNQNQFVDTENLQRYGNEEYFNTEFYILGDKNGEEIEIPAGKQVYSFSYALPPALPSSFEGQYGHVRYTIKVVLDRPWKFDQETKTAFTVINTLDLNLNPSYREPIHIQMEKTFCCLFCASPPLSVDVYAPVSGYVSGQSIPLTVDVENRSNVIVKLIKISLRKMVTYRANAPSDSMKKTKDEVHTVQEGPIEGATTRRLNMKLDIPPLPPSNLVHCSIIDLDYEIHVKVAVSGLHRNMCDRRYVTLGSVPLVGRAGAAAPRPLDDPTQPLHTPEGPDAAGGWVAPSAPPYQSLYPTLSEPVYKASSYKASTIKDRGDNEHTRLSGTEHFTPYYPTYSVAPPPVPQ